ncbi:MAG: hypothetical protein OXG85_04590 [Chloroflexi bacterium]|nr:hypothetical protein [Chloroflexota bacterium]
MQGVEESERPHHWLFNVLIIPLAARSQPRVVTLVDGMIADISTRFFLR